MYNTSLKIAILVFITQNGLVIVEATIPAKNAILELLKISL